MKKRILLILLFVISIISNAQETLTLEDCYALATKNYPLAKQKELLQQKSNYEIDAITKGKLPKMDLNAQATYQSDVIGFPSKMTGVTPINKDQYRATLDINQLLYNGGMIETNSGLKQAQTKTQQQQIEVSLYQLKTRIHQYYFSILLLQEKSELLKSKKELLQSKVQEVKSGVKYGAILPASELILEAELLKIKQQLTEIDFEKIKMTQNLSDLTFTKIDTQTILLVSNSNLENNRNNRPEIVFYNLQKQQLEFSKKILATSVLPKINAFAQAGYGNPGLNMLDNSFQPFYIAGLKANWTILDWGKNKIDLKTIDIAKEIIETEKETFELNNKMQLREIESEIGKTKQLLELDNNIIHVREKIVTSANAQMKNGVITTSEYLTEFSNLYEAKNSLKTHEVQLAAAKSSYEITNGK